ncbi:period circadian protein homolog 2 [Puma concolor]|uniref:Period circadian protein homolog 2 n=1 Tax=Puma concolor TaxID=9696 RepID=A0A6P6IHK9_PUMCO|nr:period circadian protein homolog 2 [Puma concolor]
MRSLLPSGHITFPGELHCGANMNTYAEYPPSPPAQEPVEPPRPHEAPLQEDVDMSSGSSGNETNENCPSGRGSRGSKELGALVRPPVAPPGPDAFGLLMSKSEHSTTTSGCSSEQSAKADTHKELIKTLRELRVHLPGDKKARGKASTLATLKYALRSVKQVKASEEYYQLLLSGESQACGASLPCYTAEDIEGATSEFIVKNAGMFAAAVSLVTGKILYVSDQVASIFHCKRDVFPGARFVEFLAPHDVSVFHASTTPYKLPLWGVCSGADAFTQDCMEEKSFFCRVSVGKSHENEIHYHPFRMTPYLVKVRDPQGADGQLCCVLLAERVHSGYEAPRIPPEKRIFTTTHTPNCLFQDVDERAVPLLGYLPQDLIETPLLVRLHPSDRPLMLTIHKKIVQSGGQPFDSSPIRFRARNGEYVTLDTSWSSFINPWSRKISFIIGRHRVRVGPLNEDVFSAPSCVEEKGLHPSDQELTEQIHRLLLQPVPHSGSSGYGSLGSNGSHEPLMSQTSSSDSNGHKHSRRRRTEICKNANGRVKSKSPYPGDSGEHKEKPATETQSSSCAQMKAVPVEKDSSGTSLPPGGFPEELGGKSPPAGSYQQMSCLDGVIRYLESCSEAATLKRKCEFPANVATQKAGDKRKAVAGLGPHGTETASPSKVNSHAEVSAHLTSLTLPGKAESVASLSSQCSYSSTIVHVGDKKPQPELELVEDAASGPESLDGRPCGLGAEKDPLRTLGLTKEVLAAHTQKEEQSFLLKFKEMRKLHVFQSRCHYYLQEKSKGQLSERRHSAIESSDSARLAPVECGMGPLQRCHIRRSHWVATQGDCQAIENLCGNEKKVSPPTREEPTGAPNSDALSTSSGLLDLLLHEDLCSATGSALSGSGASDSLGSSSLGCDTSGSGAGSSDTSHTSKYFGSVESSENNHKAEVKADVEESKHFIKYVLQDPVWLLMANADDSIMMTYQMPSRNLETVLKEDREKMQPLLKSQPKFTEGQTRELQDAHPWLREGRLPPAVDVTECVYCENKEEDNICVPYEEDVPTLGLSGDPDTKEEGSGAPLSHRREEQT